MSRSGEYKRPYPARLIVDDTFRAEVLRVNAMLIREGHAREGKNCPKLVAYRLKCSVHTIELILRQAKEKGLL